MAKAARRSNVFARVSPDQKYQLIGALKHSDVVGYEEDGINDAPSLKFTDVGIAVESATDVAKANADIILLDGKLDSDRQRYPGRQGDFRQHKQVRRVHTMVGNFGIVVLAIPYIPSLSRLFSFKAPSAGEVGVVLSCSAVYIVVLDFVKVAYFKVAGDLRLVPMGSAARYHRPTQTMDRHRQPARQPRSERPRSGTPAVETSP